MTAMTAQATNLGRSSATVHQVLVTRELAEEWLSNNDCNRTVSESNLQKIVRAIEDGKIYDTCEPIKRAANGRLLDGQHRCLAVARTGIAVWFWVAENVPEAAQVGMDSGKPRTPKDHLDMHSVSNSTVVSAAARIALAETPLGFVTDALRAPSKIEVLDFVNENSDIHVAAANAAAWRHFIATQPAVIAVTYMRFARVDADAAFEFFESLATMATGGAGDPRSALLRRLQTAGNERFNRTAHLALVIRAWNAWRAGEEIHKLPTPRKIPTEIL